MMVEAVVLVVAAIAVGYIVSLYLTSKPEYVGGSDFYDLSVPDSIVADYKSLPWVVGPCSIRFALFVEAAPRTLEKVDCVNPAGDITEFKPACDNYEFKRCKCTGIDCSTCLKPSYLSSLLRYGELFEFQASGYTSVNDKPYVSALLRIKTSKSSSQHYIETVTLPAVPLQQWTIISIVKEGRRFDVYYGAKLVASKILDYIPHISDTTYSWGAGSKYWKGKIGLFSGTTKAQTSEDILRDVESLVNTRGIPYALDRFSFDVNVQMPECLFGNCGKLPEIVPMNPFAVRVTNVA
jgi:hypothetical protein